MNIDFGSRRRVESVLPHRPRVERGFSPAPRAEVVEEEVDLNKFKMGRDFFEQGYSKRVSRIDTNVK